MPDGNQGAFASRPAAPFPQAFNIPGATNPAGGLNRFIALAMTLTVSSVGLAVIVLLLQAYMPAGSKPSDLIGSLHGGIENTEMTVKRDTATEYERQMTIARTAPTINLQMEAEVSRQQQEAIARSLATREAAAQIADAACLGAPLATMLMGDTREARELKATMQAGCAEAARIRAEITQIQAEAARNGSALMQRYRPN
jgi:hypothetical protein